MADEENSAAPEEAAATTRKKVKKKAAKKKATKKVAASAHPESAPETEVVVPTEAGPDEPPPAKAPPAEAPRAPSAAAPEGRVGMSTHGSGGEAESGMSGWLVMWGPLIIIGFLILVFMGDDRPPAPVAAAPQAPPPIAVDLITPAVEPGLEVSPEKAAADLAEAFRAAGIPLPGEVGEPAQAAVPPAPRVPELLPPEMQANPWAPVPGQPQGAPTAPPPPAYGQYPYHRAYPYPPPGYGYPPPGYGYGGPPPGYGYPAPGYGGYPPPMGGRAMGYGSGHPMHAPGMHPHRGMPYQGMPPGQDARGSAPPSPPQSTGGTDESGVNRGGSTGQTN